MSDTFDEGIAPEGGYDEGPGEGSADGLDPFEPDFGEQLGEIIRETVQDGIAMGLSDSATLPPEPEYGPPAEYMPEAVTPEGVQMADSQIAAVFDTMVEHVGEFDRADALDFADERFAEMLSAGVPLEQAIPQALAAGAEDAASTRRGEPLVERLVAAELGRVGNVDPDQVRVVADQYLPLLIEETGGDQQEAVRQAVELAASAVAGHRWRPDIHPGRMGETVAQYYGMKARAIQAMGRVGQPEAKVETMKPGQHLTAEQIVAKHSRIMRGQA